MPSMHLRRAGPARKRTRGGSGRIPRPRAAPSAVDLERRGREKCRAAQFGTERHLAISCASRPASGVVRFQRLRACPSITGPTSVEAAPDRRCAVPPWRRPACSSTRRRDVLLDEQHAQRRAALAGAAESWRTGRRAPPARAGRRNRRSWRSARRSRRSGARWARGARPSVRLMAQAVSVEPVKATPATRGSATSARADRVRPRPAGGAAHRRGRRRGAADAPPRRAISGVCSAGLATTALPAASAAATWPMKMASGKFQGLMQAKTPRPCSSVRLRSPVGPGRRCGGCEVARAHGWRSSGRNPPPRAPRPRASRIVLPASAHSSAISVRQLCLQQIGRPLQAGGALCRRRAHPSPAPRAPASDRPLRRRRPVGLDHRADDGADGRREQDRPAFAALARRRRRAARRASRCQPACSCCRRAPRVGARSAEIDAARNWPLGAEEVRGRGMRGWAGLSRRPPRRPDRRRSPRSARASSTMRLTNEVLAPFSSSRRTR